MEIAHVDWRILPANRVESGHDTVLRAERPALAANRKDVTLARTIRFAQSLGLSLKEIAAISEELHADQSAGREIAVLDDQIARLEQKAADLMKLTRYLHAKRDWIAQGRTQDQPSLASFWQGPEGDQAQ